MKGDDIFLIFMEEDQYIVLQFDIIDFLEKFLSDGGEDGRDVDYLLINMVLNYIVNYDMYCKQEFFLVNEFRNFYYNLFVYFDNYGIEVILFQSVVFYLLFRIIVVFIWFNYSVIYFLLFDFD